jgi:hypothetical protein
VCDDAGTVKKTNRQDAKKKRENQALAFSCFSWRLGGSFLFRSCEILFSLLKNLD